MITDWETLEGAQGRLAPACSASAAIGALKQEEAGHGLLLCACSPSNPNPSKAPDAGRVEDTAAKGLAGVVF